jgi:DNA-binding NarL/FixJ family response regulator
VEVGVGEGRAARLLLVDDDQMLRELMGVALEMEGFEIVGAAGDGSDAVRLADSLRPDVVLMDVTMPRMDGIEATRAIRDRHPEIRVVVVTMHDEPAVIARAVSAGASAYVYRGFAVEELVQTVRAVALGDVVLSPRVASSMLGQFAAAGESVALTSRQREILALMAEGFSTEEIAQRLAINRKTVRSHLTGLYRRLEARNRTEAVVRAVRVGIVSLR